ncbi:Uncharacterized protein Fot_53370 [Forsythia ovata]|uniref:Uncharacterized protein n=1 Tax=Forsythia ovata TaxID=205694 RepID=A0ABD1PIG1_9LAMI
MECYWSLCATAELLASKQKPTKQQRFTEGGSEHNWREVSFITTGGDSDPNVPSPSNCSDSKKPEKGTATGFQIKGCSHRICSKRSSRRLQKPATMGNATMGSSNRGR